MTEARVVLVGKPGCHLCDIAREVVAAVCRDTGESFREVSLFDAEELFDRYGELIPVVLVDGVQHQYWQVDGSRLAAALAG